MQFRVEIRPAARREFDEASDWYRDRDRNVRDRFVAAVGETIRKISRRPPAYPIVFGSGVRRARVPRFPYSIFYISKAETVFVISVFHDSRNPIIWRGRID